MKTLSTPLNIWVNTVELSHLMVEAQAVIGMRMMGMAGLWPVTASENARMVHEKIEAGTKAATAAGRVALHGGSADEIATAILKPYRKTTRANLARLGKRRARAK